MLNSWKLKNKIFNFENCKRKAKAKVLWFCFPTLSMRHKGKLLFRFASFCSKSEFSLRPFRFYKWWEVSIQWSINKYPTGKINTIFLKNCYPTSRIRHEKKNCIRRHTIFRNYCRYYSCHHCSDNCSNNMVIPMSCSYCRYYNRDDCSDDCNNDIVIPMSGSYCRYYSHHAIVVMTVCDSSNDSSYGKSYADGCNFFFSSMDARCRAPFIRKNRVLQSDDDAKVRAAFPGAKEQRAKNDGKCAFLGLSPSSSWECAGSSRVVGTFWNCVSLSPQ